MWKVLWKSIWEILWIRVSSGLGFATMVWGLILLLSPKVAGIAPSSVLVDSRIWFGITFAILVLILLRTSWVANEYKKKSEGEDNVRIVYNENFPLCRELSDAGEIVRVGYRVIGKREITNPVVFASNMFRVGERESTRVPIVSTPLSAFIKRDIVHRSYHPSYWVNVFKHVLNTPIIELCYDGYQSLPVVLEIGCYELNLVAQGTGSGGSVGALIVTIKEDFSLSLRMEGLDQWNK